MALANYSLPFHSALPSAFIPSSPAPNIDSSHGLLYNPADHQQDTSDPSNYNNNPYSAPTPRRIKQRKRSGNAYLPPPNSFTRYPQENHQEENGQYSESLNIQPSYSEQRLHTSHVDQNYPQKQASEVNDAFSPREPNVDYGNTGEYVHDPSGDYDRGTPFVRQPAVPYRLENSNYNTRRYLPGQYNPSPSNLPPSTPAPKPVFSQQFDPQVRVPQADYNKVKHNLNYPQNNFVGQGPHPDVGQQVGSPNPSNPHLAFGDSTSIPNGHGTAQGESVNTQPSSKTPGTGAASSGAAPQQEYPARPSGFVKVDTRQSSGSGQPGKTQLHAILDYDDDDYYEEEIGDPNVSVVKQSVTPLQGPILIRNGSVPVVPLYAYDAVRTPNGTLLQIPILWTALSLALGVEVRGQVVRGVPCVKRHYQLFCPTAGNTYPIDRIEHFIDENKALMKRMYGAFGDGAGADGGGTGGRRKRSPAGKPDELDPTPHIPPGGLDPTPGDSYFRRARQTDGFSRARADPPLDAANPNNGSGKVDACESKTEIITPYWALNSARKLRAVVNTMHFEQAVHQEVCSKGQTARCAGECACEQKYKWHRLLAYDPDEDCSGIFMDWFLFPSCCVCRCNP